MKRSSFWWKLIHLNPVLFRTAVVTVGALLTALGIHISDAIPDNLTNATFAIFALIGAFWARDGVFPEAKVVVYQPDPVDHPAAILPGPATPTGVTDASLVSAARAAPVGDTY